MIKNEYFINYNITISYSFIIIYIADGNFYIMNTKYCRSY